MESWLGTFKLSWCCADRPEDAERGAHVGLEPAPPTGFTRNAFIQAVSGLDRHRSPPHKGRASPTQHVRPRSPSPQRASSPTHPLHPAVHHRRPSPARHPFPTRPDGGQHKIHESHEHHHNNQELKDALQAINEHAVDFALYEKHHQGDDAHLDAKGRTQGTVSGHTTDTRPLPPQHPSRAQVMKRSHDLGLL